MYVVKLTCKAKRAFLLCLTISHFEQCRTKKQNKENKK